MLLFVLLYSLISTFSSSVSFVAPEFTPAPYVVAFLALERGARLPRSNRNETRRDETYERLDCRKWKFLKEKGKLFFLVTFVSSWTKYQSGIVQKCFNSSRQLRYSLLQLLLSKCTRCCTCTTNASGKEEWNFLIEAFVFQKIEFENLSTVLSQFDFVLNLKFKTQHDSRYVARNLHSSLPKRSSFIFFSGICVTCRYNFETYHQKFSYCIFLSCFSFCNYFGHPERWIFRRWLKRVKEGSDYSLLVELYRQQARPVIDFNRKRCNDAVLSLVSREQSNGLDPPHPFGFIKCGISRARATTSRSLGDLLNFCVWTKSTSSKFVS